MTFTQRLLATLKELVTSKKVLIAILTAVAGALIKDPAFRDRVIAVGTALVLGQGMADFGKSATQIKTGS